jgi:hypothetical protein
MDIITIKTLNNITIVNFYNIFTARDSMRLPKQTKRRKLFNGL